jgi:predicted metal-dependent peptidase
VKNLINNSVDLAPAITYLLTRSAGSGERYYAEMLLLMQRRFGTHVPTAGVNVVKGQVTLHVNPEFFASLSVPLQAAVLKHECLHVLSAHFDRRGVGNFQAWNIATDAAINEFIPEFHAPGLELKPVTVAALSTQLGKQLDRQRAGEYYLAAMPQNPESSGSGGESGTGALAPHDDHDVWNAADADSEADAAEACKGVAKEALRRAGSAPGQVQGLLDALLSPSVSWRSELRRFVANAAEFTIESSKKRRNRRYGLSYPGAIREPKLHLAVAVDTSGSVSDAALKQFFSEIEEISKHATVTVIEADCEIQKVFQYKPGQEIEISGRGGTAYQPAFDHAATLGVDALIYFGDMDASDTPSKPTFPVLWAIVGSQNPPASFGISLRVEVTE